MNRLKRILGMRESNADSENAAPIPAKQVSDVEVKTLRQELLDVDGFADYAAEVAKQKNQSVDDFSDTELETLYQVWSEHKTKDTDSTSLIAIGVGVIGALALVSPSAEANIGSTIANQIVRVIEPFVRNLLNTAMSTIGLDIGDGSDKVAIANGQGVDAQNEVMKTIYNKEVARAAEPAPNECVSQEAAKRTQAAEEQANATIDDYVVRDTVNRIYIRHTITRTAARIAESRKQYDDKIFEAEKVSPNAPPAEKVRAMTQAASLTTFNSSSNMGPAQKVKAEAHVAALFKDTAPAIDIALEVDTPTARAFMDKQVEHEATLNHCRFVFERDIAERTGTATTPSFRQALNEKIQSEYGSESFLQEINGRTHAVPLLKTLIEQQSFSNMMAVRSYEQQSEMLKLQALQLKEAVKSSMS